MIFINTTPKFYIGLDNHKYLHTVCMISYEADKLLSFEFKNEPRYYDDALKKIIDITKTKDGIIFGFEDVNSAGFLFAQYLANKGFEIKYVNAALASAYRTSLPTFHKTDDYDAWCVAKVLKDTYKQLPNFDYEQVFENIRLLINLRKSITKQQVDNYLLLHQHLDKVYPGYTQFFSELRMKSALSFYQHFPSPRHLKGYTKELLYEEMKSYGQVFTISKAEKILTIIRANQIPFINTTVENIIVDTVNDVHSKVKRLAEIDKQLEPLVEETGYKLHTIPGIKIVTASKLISEIGDINRFNSPHALAKYAGIAPITVGSGGHNKEYASRGGNRQLRATFYFLAVGMIATDKYKTPRNTLFREYFLNRVANGKTKKQALICVMRQLTKIIYVMMKNKSEYIEPAKKAKVIEAVVETTEIVASNN